MDKDRPELSRVLKAPVAPVEPMPYGLKCRQPSKRSNYLHLEELMSLAKSTTESWLICERLKSHLHKPGHEARPMTRLRQPTETASAQPPVIKWEI